MYLQEWDKIKGGRLIRLGAFACWKDKSAKERLEERAWEDGAKRMSEEQRSVFRSVQKEQLGSGIISISSVNQVKFRNNVFLVKKKSGTWCQILDCRPLNATMKRLHFIYESERTVEYLIQKDDYAIMLDLAQAYYLIPVSPDLKLYLSFSFEGTDYSFEGMPFGFMDAPRIFTKIMRKETRAIKEKWNVRVIAYLDDMIILHQDKADFRNNQKPSDVVLGKFGVHGSQGQMPVGTNDEIHIFGLRLGHKRIHSKIGRRQSFFS
ncbi:uncharacterized protein MONOS_10445 [Monocercomonoides exilis]|uniref:uncharacterized protein n=1 Tax=Monocercomonoides exilis TaxID=2049356 RepID=UPI00355A53F4|nr:hypothetical protein MONOS_10445 [Monocercomonoides exilis]|eukprot:MONOS_10445.1-p1 / transcript=MONOS_10445.1 / gene=MONOS_10445 / organism=Monocercomonoides_exilis_PA203 / gene_product=unspecified product / transcript_product=unspecified product / location=Mono_scaffold00476:950-1741(+) / protein_length=263 / sequence_SO=supercontig / SO=protein_coding / is_pseudo=false